MTFVLGKLTSPKIVKMAKRGRPDYMTQNAYNTQVPAAQFFHSKGRPNMVSCALGGANDEGAMGIVSLRYGVFTLEQAEELHEQLGEAIRSARTFKEEFEKRGIPEGFGCPLMVAEKLHKAVMAKAGSRVSAAYLARLRRDDEEESEEVGHTVTKREDAWDGTVRASFSAMFLGLLEEEEILDILELAAKGDSL